MRLMSVITRSITATRGVNGEAGRMPAGCSQSTKKPKLILGTGR